jgi:two-component system chemotaxis response regulator CheY
MSNLDGELAQDYLADCEEYLATLETEVLAVKMGANVLQEERLDLIFRTARAIGGPAAYFELVKIQELSRQIENLVALLRCRHSLPTAEQTEVLLQACDGLRALFADPAASNQADTAAILSELHRLIGHHPAPAAISVASSSTATALAPRPLRILLAEDDFACRLLLETYLARHGQCHAAVNGKEAVDAFRKALEQEKKFDLICMDIMMPEMDGREAVRQIRALEEARGILSSSGVKIFMTTTVQEVREVFLCFRELCDAYLMKPIDLSDLLRQMKAFQLIP